MGSYATLFVGGREVDWYKNGIPYDIGLLFSSGELAVDTIIEDGERVIRRRLITSAGSLADRLDVLGLGMEGARTGFEARFSERNERRRLLGLAGSDYRAWEELDFDDWLNWLPRLFDGSRLTWRDPHGAVQTYSSQDFVHDFDTRLFLRAVVAVIPASTEVHIDISGLAEGGWIDDSYDPQGEAAAYIAETLLHDTAPIVLTEGSTDATVLRDSLAVLKPHLAGFIRFPDFSNGAEGSASALVRTVRAFQAAGIRHRVVALFDNDGAAAEALRGLDRRSLPESYSVLQYPTLPLATSYPVHESSGVADRDVNGIAASLEMYLGNDVLVGAGGHLRPVRMKGGSTHGEIEGKSQVLRAFRKKLKLAVADPSMAASQDWSGLSSIVDLLVGHLAVHVES